jgi:hypothetical protein
MRTLLLALVLLSVSRSATAACVISGARPTVPLPTMLSGQEFSFVATRDCEILRFTINDTTVLKIPTLVGPVGTGLRAYSVELTESEWDYVVARSGSTLTWNVTARTSAGVMTRLVTTNDLTVGGGVSMSLARADAKLVGAEGYAGYSVSGAGDLDADGRDDLIIGDPTVGAYVVLGPVSGTFDLSMADATLEGNVQSVSGAGDVDGDGHDDVLLGAGSAYLVLGPVSGTVDLSFADATLVGETFGCCTSVSGAGDVDGNGHDDLLVNNYTDGEGGTWAGAAYLVLGPVSGTLSLSLADAKLVGEDPDDRAGISISGAGDVDGDGLDDLLVGAPGHDERGGRDGTGAAYLLLGPVTGTRDLSLADAEVVGGGGDGIGYDVAGAGDVDGDGHDDLLLAAAGNSEGVRNAGDGYLVLGPVRGTRHVSRADAHLVGQELGGPTLVASAGDVDGEGHDDLLIGTPYEGSSRTGAAYLVLGPVTGTLDLTFADAKFLGEAADDHVGEPGTFAGAGDVDGDGHDDLLFGAAANGDGGAVFLISGGGL